MNGLTPYQKLLASRGNTLVQSLAKPGMEYISRVPVPQSPATRKPLLRSLPIAKTCQHYLGDSASEKIGCGSKRKVSCAIKGEVSQCFCLQSCMQFCTAPAPKIEQIPPVRHLLHHCWPRKLSAGTWQRNLDQLKQRWWMFNGKRVIAVATSNDSHSLEAVQEHMKGYDCEWIHVQNDGKLREVKTFRPLFDHVAEFTGPEHYTFYSQGKGVTKPINRGVSIHMWTMAMYELALDYWPLVQESLQTKHVAGSFKKSVGGAFRGSPSQWHYSGSFCWFKNSELFTRDWTDIEQVWFGIESYPSRIFTREESACLFFDQTTQFNLYNLKFWESVNEELCQWREAHKHQRTSKQD